MENLIKVKKLHPDAKLPTKSHGGDLGYDLYACEAVELNPHSIFPNQKSLIKVPTGIAIQFPEGWGGFIKERSSFGVKGHEIRGGVIDHEYTGEIIVIIELKNDNAITKHEKLAQIVPIPVTNFDIQEVDEFEDTVRGDGKFGSTGTHYNEETV